MALSSVGAGPLLLIDSRVGVMLFSAPGRHIPSVPAAECDWFRPWRTIGYRNGVNIRKSTLVKSLARPRVVAARSGSFLRRRAWWLAWPQVLPLCTVVVLAVAAGLPLFELNLMSGHDALVYLPRTVEFWEGLRAGEIFPRWAPDLDGGYGLPLFNFMPPFVYYLSSLLHFFGLSFLAAENMACLVILIGAGMGMYVLGRSAFGWRGGLVGAAAYLFAPYLLVVLYVRHGLADLTAFAFIPFAVWGLYRLACTGRSQFGLIVTLAVALLLLGSNTVALITFPFLVLFVLCLAYVRRNTGVLAQGAASLGLGLGLSAFFWVPAFMERGYVQMQRVLEGYLDYRNHFVYPQQLWYSTWGYGGSVPGPNDGMSFMLGYVNLTAVVLAAALVWRMRSRRESPLVWFALCLFAVAAFLTTTASTFVWERLSILQLLQFSWRFLSLATVAAAFLCGFPFSLLKPGNKWAANVVLGLLIAAVVGLAFPLARPERFRPLVDVFMTPADIRAGGISTTSAEEHDPIWVVERPPGPARDGLALPEGGGRFEVVGRASQRQEYRVMLTEPALVRANTFYFPGWVLTVDGVPRPVEVAEPYGLMDFTLEPGEHTVVLSFEDTPIRLWATRLSLFSLLLMALELRVPRLRPRGRREARPIAETISR